MQSTLCKIIKAGKLSNKEDETSKPDPEAKYEVASVNSTFPERLIRPTPELNLTVEHISGGTSVTIPSAPFKIMDILGIFLGWLFICVGFWGIIRILFGIFVDRQLYFATVMTFPIGMGFLYYAKRVLRIELRRETINFVIQFGRLISRTISITRHREIEIWGVFRSVDTEVGTVEEYIITIERPRSFFLPWKRSFCTDCNERQGDWIVSALKSWSKRKAEMQAENEITLRD